MDSLFGTESFEPVWGLYHIATAGAFMLTESELLTTKKLALLTLREQMTSIILETSRHVGEIARRMDPKAVRAFLRTECGLPSSELTTYVQLAEQLGDRMDSLKGRNVSFPLAKALVTADDVTRREAIDQIEAGSMLDVRDVKAISRRIQEARFDPADLELIKRRKKVARMAGANLRRLKNEVERGIYELLCEVDEFIDREIPDSTEDWHVDPDTPEYAVAVEKIRNTASNLLADFRLVYGHVTPVAAADFKNADQNDPSTVISKAWYALARFAEGKFGIEGGFAFDTATNLSRPRDIVNALDELISDHNVEPRRLAKGGRVRATPADGSRKYTSLELCAGAGGLALGLQAAGFHSLGMFERNKDAAATMRLNQPDWPVYEEDIRRDFREFAGRVDVLAGGLPCQPFSHIGSRKGRESEVDMFRDGVRIVREVQPRAFVFENVQGFTFPGFAAYRAELLQGFEAAGYEVQSFILDAKNFGIPQTRNRLFIVGMKRGELNRYRRPPASTNDRSFIGLALADLMAAEGWSGAREWSEEFGDKFSPTVVCHSSSAYPSANRTWGRSGINPRGVALTAPTDEDAAAVTAEGGVFLPRMTIRMRARLQAFSDHWKFVGSKTSQATQIGNAVPPKLGMIVGLSLKAALEGNDVDYEEAVRKAVIDDDLIGKPAPVRKVFNLNAMVPRMDEADWASPVPVQRELVKL